MHDKKPDEPSTPVERPAPANAERLAEATSVETLSDLRDGEKNVDINSTSDAAATTLTPDSTATVGDKERADGSDTGGVM